MSSVTSPLPTELTPDTKMKRVLHLFTPVVSPKVTLQKYLWRLNLAKRIPVFPTQLSVARILLIL